MRRAVLLGGLLLSLVFAWLNFLMTTRWADQPGALNGWRRPWYALALVVVTALLVATRRSIGGAARTGRAVSVMVLLAGVCYLCAAMFSRLPLSVWGQIPFKDDWTELYQQAVNGVALLRRGSVVGWNWGLLGGYPTSTDIAQNFGVLAFIPMMLLGDRVGYHVLHALVFFALPLVVWWDVGQEDRETGLLAAGFAFLFTAGYFGTLGNSGDTNSLMGVFSAMVALAGSRAARTGRRWGGPLLMVGLTLGLYTHQAFFVYAVILLALEALYFRDPRAAIRLVVAAAFAVVVALPVYWESLRYPTYVSFNNTVYSPGAPTDWRLFLRLVYYNVEILALPGRWFNDYRSLANVWLPVLVAAAVLLPRSRAGFYAWAAVVVQALLRLNTPVAGAMFDRIQHMLPLLVAPALGGFVLRFAGTRRLAIALVALIALYVGTSFAPVRHVRALRDFDPPLIDRIARLDGMIAVEVSPHRDMNADPVQRTPTTPFDVHFEGLLPGLAGQRFYSQMIDGWVWNVWRGQVIGAGTFAGRSIRETPPDRFVAEMCRWGVRHLFVWTDASRSYLGAVPAFVERWRGGPWSHFELTGSDVRSVVTASGRGALRNLDLLGGDVALEGVTAGDEVVVRANYYPAWRGYAGGSEVPLNANAGQIAFRAPRSGSYIVHLAYPRYRWLSLLAVVAFGAGIVSMGPANGFSALYRRAHRASDRTAR